MNQEEVAPVVYPSDMWFTPDPKTDIQKSEFIQVAPLSGTSFGSGNTIEFEADSQAQLMDLSECYIKATVKLTGGSVTSAAANFSAYNSMASCIKQVRTIIGGVQCENQTNYNNGLAYDYRRMSSSQKDNLKVLEAYTLNTVLAGSVIKSNGRQMTHKLNSGVWNCDKLIPLQWIAGGVRLELTLSTLAEFLALNTAVATDFQLIDVRLVCKMITPSVSYAQRIDALLRSGKNAIIPMEISRTSTYLPTADLSQTNVIRTGYIKSLNEIAMTHRNTSALTDVAKDSFAQESGSLSTAQFKIGSDLYPKNFQIGQSNATGGSVQVESYYQQVRKYPHIDLSETADGNLNSAVFYDFKTHKDVSNSNVAVDDGVIEASLLYSTNVSSANYYTVDSRIKHGANLIVSLTDVLLDVRAL